MKTLAPCSCSLLLLWFSRLSRFLLFASFALLCGQLLAQNWEVKLGLHLPIDDEMRTNGFPTNAVVASYLIKDRTNYVFVGDTNQLATYLAARKSVIDTWLAGPWSAYQSNKLFQTTNTIGNNLANLAQLFDANQTFLQTVNAGGNISTAVLSNQTVRSARILRQLEPILRDLYKGN